LSELLLAGQEQFQKMRIVTDEAISEVDKRFGDGLEKQGKKHLRYHNGLHTRAVSMGAVALGKRLCLSKTELAVAQVAGAAHDIVQLHGSGTNERESAEWIEDKLRGYVPAEALAMARLAILGTEPVFQGGTITEQKAQTQEYPTKRAELVAKIVASADLGNLYTPEGPALSHELYHELSGHAAIDTGLVTFQKNQLKLVHSYEYPLPEAGRLFATHKGQVQAYVVKTLDQLEAGEIHSWQQLIEQDAAFRAAHS
jgi:hypothetical protein